MNNVPGFTAEMSLPRIGQVRASSDFSANAVPAVLHNVVLPSAISLTRCRENCGIRFMMCVYSCDSGGECFRDCYRQNYSCKLGCEIRRT